MSFTIILSPTDTLQYQIPNIHPNAPLKWHPAPFHPLSPLIREKTKKKQNTHEILGTELCQLLVIHQGFGRFSHRLSKLFCLTSALLQTRPGGGITSHPV